MGFITQLLVGWLRLQIERTGLDFNDA